LRIAQRRALNVDGVTEVAEAPLYVVYFKGGLNFGEAQDF